MKPTSLPRKLRRLPGEIAFDRCFLPLVAVTVLQIIYQYLSMARDRGQEYSEEAAAAAAMPPPVWHAWLWFILGLVLAVLWVRAIIALARAWNDPSARILRFSSCVVLIPFACITYGLLLYPFR